MDKWISVEDRLPNTRDLRKLFAVCNISDLRSADVVAWRSLTSSFIETYYHDPYDDKITHWMPLPEPPKDI